MPGIASDRSAINVAPIAAVGSDNPVTPAVGDFMQAFRSGFITVDDLARRGASLPAAIAGSQQDLQDQLQIRPLARQAQAGALGGEIAIQPKRTANALSAEDLRGRQITEAGRQLPTETEVSADTASREKKAQFLNAVNSTVPGVRENAIANAAEETIIDAWTQSHGQPPPEQIQKPGGGVEPKPIEDWILETYGPNALAVDAQAVINRPDVQQGYNAYAQEARNRPFTYVRGTPEYLQALKDDLKQANLKESIQAAQIKALPQVLETQAKFAAEAPERAQKAEAELTSQRNTTLKNFREQTEAYAKIQGLKNKPNPNNSDDLALIYSYVKMLDPGSVVREGEIKLAQQATPLLGALVQKYHRLFGNTGAILDPTTRTDYLNAVDVLFKGAQEAAAPEVERISSTATARGANPEAILNSAERATLGTTPAPPAANASGIKVGDVVTLKDGRRVRVKAVTATGIVPE